MTFERRPPHAHDDALIASLRAVDGLIARALAAAPAVYGWEAGRVQFRGLFIGEEDVERLMARHPGAPPFSDDPGTDQAVDPIGGGYPALVRLGDRYGLTPFDQAAMLIALAPEVDLRYERLYAFLQDDVTKRRPSVDLILNLLCTSASDKLAGRERFAPDAPLIREQLMHLEANAGAVRPTALARTVTLDEHVVRALLGESGLDSRLARYAVYSTPSILLASLPLPEGHAAALVRLVNASRRTGEPLRLLFHGDSTPLKQRAAEAVAAEAGLPLLSIAFARLHAAGRDLTETLTTIFRMAEQSGALVFLDVDGFALPETDERAHRAAAVRRLAGEIGGEIAKHQVSAIIAAPAAWAGGSGLEQARVIDVAFPPASVAVRRACWRAQANGAGVALTDRDLSVLSERFRLYPHQIDAAAAAAVTQAAWRGETPSATHLFATARALSGQTLASLARRVEPVFSWDDLVLPASVTGHLRALCGRVANRQRVLGDWGFERTLPLGKGVTALFAGSSGVGKTMAAEVIAQELQLDLYKIDLSGIVSKYIGETEKNLERVFTAAEGASAILFFDEADALFGKRSEVRDSHDRYANLEISYLLQKMEAYDGVAILASNLRHSLDDAFVRRLAFTIHFPFPDQAHRRRIWTAVWPAAAPVDDDIDREWLAAHFKLTGGNIKNVALASAFLAAEEGCAIGMRHVLAALDREYQKMGKPLDLTGIAPPVLEVAS